jgi:hypothetical protein
LTHASPWQELHWRRKICNARLGGGSSANSWYLRLRLQQM